MLTAMASPHFAFAQSPRHSADAGNSGDSVASVAAMPGAPIDVAVDIPVPPWVVKVDIPGAPMKGTADIPVVTSLPEHTDAGHEAISGTDPVITLAGGKQPTLPPAIHTVT